MEFWISLVLLLVVLLFVIPWLINRTLDKVAEQCVPAQCSGHCQPTLPAVALQRRLYHSPDQLASEVLF